MTGLCARRALGRPARGGTWCAARGPVRVRLARRAPAEWTSGGLGVVGGGECGRLCNGARRSGCDEASPPPADGGGARVPFSLLSCDAGPWAGRLQRLLQGPVRQRWAVRVTRARAYRDTYPPLARIERRGSLSAHAPPRGRLVCCCSCSTGVPAVDALRTRGQGQRQWAGQEARPSLSVGACLWGCARTAPGMANASPCVEGSLPLY